MDQSKPKVLFIVGSMRKASLNRQLAQQAAELLQDKAELSWLEYADIPYMNQDIEYPAPEAVIAVREQVQDADALWIFSPEYNHSIPGVLKNLIDWVSRPLSQEPGTPSAIRGKVVTYSSCAGGSGGHFMMSHMNEVLRLIGCDVKDTVLTSVHLDREAFTTSQLNLNPDEEASLKAQAECLLRSLI